MRIGINCGHTLGGQPGSGAVEFLDESVETRKVGKTLIDLFRRGGHEVFDCTDDYAQSTSDNLRKIAEMANTQPLDLFVSIHFNSGGGTGTEVFTYGGSMFSEAKQVCKALSDLGFKNRGIKDGSGLYVIRRTKARSMLVEVCFVDSDDAELYRNIGYEKIANAIFNAIAGKEYVDIADIVNFLKQRGIISDGGLWSGYCAKNSNVYWFCRKLSRYIMTKRTGETAEREYENVHDIAWDFNFRGVITDTALWERLMTGDSNIYWLLRKALQYCRTH